MNKGITKAFWVILLLLASLLSSYIIIFGGVKFTLYFASAVVGFIFLFSQPSLLLYLLILYVFLILGPLNQIANIDSSWAPYLMCLELLFMSLIGSISGKESLGRNQLNKKIPKYIWGFLFLILLSIFSTISGNPNSYTLLISIRNTFFIWGIYFIFTTANINRSLFRNCWHIFILIGFIQLPMALYQRLVIASARFDEAPWDSVMGTFPGTEKSGDSGGMAFFLLALIAITLSLWRHAQISGKRTIMYSCILFSPILLAEVKVVYLLIPIMTILVFRTEIKTNPLIFIVGIISAFMIMGGVFLAGKHFNSPNEIKLNQPFDIQKEYDEILGFSTKSDVMNRKTGEMGRFSALNFWWVNNKNEPVRCLLGYGLGSASSDGISNFGSVAKKYRPYVIGNTTASSTLWETGLIGLFVYAAIFFYVAQRASQLSKINEIPIFSRALLFSSSVIIWTRIFLLPYNVPSATSQVFIFFLFGTVAYWNKQVNIIEKN